MENYHDTKVDAAEAYKDVRDINSDFVKEVSGPEIDKLADAYGRQVQGFLDRHEFLGKTIDFVLKTASSIGEHPSHAHAASHSGSHSHPEAHHPHPASHSHPETHVHATSHSHAVPHPHSETHLNAASNAHVSHAHPDPHSHAGTPHSELHSPLHPAGGSHEPAQEQPQLHHDGFHSHGSATSDAGDGHQHGSGHDTQIDNGYHDYHDSSWNPDHGGY